MHYNNRNPNFSVGDRQFFFPFLLGGLAGAGLVGISRPRPVFVNPAQYAPYPPSPYPSYPPLAIIALLDFILYPVARCLVAATP